MKNIKPLRVLNDDQEIHRNFVKSIVSGTEAYVKGLGGLKGLVARNMFAAIKAIRPGYVDHIAEVLSADYVDAFSDFHEEYRSSQNLPAASVQPLIDYVSQHKPRAEQLFWQVADNNAKKRSGSFLGKNYGRIRPMIESHLPAVFDFLCAEIEKFTQFDVPENETIQ